MKFQEKESKSNYHNLIMKFLNNIIKTSLSLNNINESDQQKKLKDFLHFTNTWLRNNKCQIKEEAKNWKSIPKFINLFEGVLLPFMICEDEIQSNLAVRIIEDDFRIFVTRKRFPYQILIETIE